MARIENNGESTNVSTLLLLLVLFVVFLLPSALKSLGCLAFGVSLFLVSMAEGKKGLLCGMHSRTFYFLLLGLGFSILLILLLSQWSKNVLLADTLFLLVAVFVFPAKNNTNLECTKVVKSIFYYVALILISAEVVMNFGSTNAVYLQAYDKNYFALILFLFFCWCWNEKRLLGVVICFLSALPVGSRNYIFMLFLFFAIELIFYFQKKKHCVLEDKAARPTHVFLVFILMLCTIGAFSYWWSSSVVGSSTGEYMTGLNDKSNAIRFNSDWYACSYLAGHPELIFYGYDSDIIEAMNIVQSSALDGTESAFDGVFYNGYRIVQPHHSVLNLLLKEGVIYSIFYFALLSLAMAPLIRKKNASIWVPYLFACMFMHSLLMTYYLVFLMIVLSQDNRGLFEGKPILVNMPNSNSLNGSS